MKKLEHELGHAIGLQHTNIASVMYNVFPWILLLFLTLKEPACCLFIFHF